MFLKPKIRTKYNHETENRKKESPYKKRGADRHENPYRRREPEFFQKQQVCIHVEMSMVGDHPDDK